MTDLGTAIRAKFPTATSASADLTSGYNMLRDALEAVLDLHQPIFSVENPSGPMLCAEDGPQEDEFLMKHWPCPTAVAIARALGIEL